MRIYKNPNRAKHTVCAIMTCGAMILSANPIFADTYGKIAFSAGGGSGSMETFIPTTETSYTVPDNGFTRNGYSFTGWEGSDGADYSPGDILQVSSSSDTPFGLRAKWEKQNTTYSDGDEIDLYLKGGESVELSDIPGGATYQVWEETPSGWQMITQENPAGNIVPNQTVASRFVNEYIPGIASLILTGTKTLDGRSAEAGQFTFELLNENDEVIQTVTNSEAGLIKFDQLVFRNPGRFTYKIREIRGEDTGINYDTHVEEIAIAVEDDGHGNLTASAVYDADGATFANESKPGMLKFTKITENGNPGDTEFTFELRLTDSYGRPLEGLHILKLDANGQQILPDEEEAEPTPEVTPTPGP